MTHNTGKIAVISGAAHGIGKAVALLLAEQVKALVLIDIDAQGLARTQAEMNEKSGTVAACYVYAADVTQEPQVRQVFAEIRNICPRIDILINAVGGSSSSGEAGVLTENMSLQQWQAMLSLNLNSAFLCCREVIPLMKKQGYGRIINFSSIARHGPAETKYPALMRHPKPALTVLRANWPGKSHPSASPAMLSLPVSP